MKKLVFTFCVLFSLFSRAQNKESNSYCFPVVFATTEQIIGKWQLLEQEALDVNIDDGDGIVQFSKNFIQFKEDGACIIKYRESKKTGTWTLTEERFQLKTLIDNQEKVYTFISIDENQLKWLDPELKRTSTFTRLN